MNDWKTWHWIVLAALVAAVVYGLRRRERPRKPLLDRLWGAADYVLGGEPPAYLPASIMAETPASVGEAMGGGLMKGGCGCGCK